MAIRISKEPRASEQHLSKDKAMTTLIKTLVQTSGGILRLVPLSALILTNVCGSPALANTDHTQAMAKQQEDALSQTTKANALIKVVRDATERFKDVSVAVAEG